MEQKELIKKTKRKVEKLVLLVYGIYVVTLCIMTGTYNWGSWIYPIAVGGYLACFLVHVKDYRDEAYRAYLFSILMLLDYCIYGTRCESFAMLTASLAFLAVLLGTFCIERIIALTAAATIFLYLYHLIILKTVLFSDGAHALVAFLQIFALLALEGVVYYQIRLRNQNEAALREEMQAMYKMERSRDDFMVNLSHEIRTPVNTVVGMTEMILRNKISESVRDCAVDAQMASRNLLGTVSDVLDFSELQSGRVSLTEEVYNLTSTINDALNITMAQKKRKKFQIIVDCDTDIPCGLLGDEQKISRVLSNILSNALKFTKEGAIILRVGMRKEDAGVNLTISVQDTGIGIEEKNIEKLFTSFSQVDTKRNRQEGGIGLGLAIAKALVEKMHGFINVRSKPGVGTEVRFVIPQKVVDSRPMIRVEKKEEFRILYYVKMSKFDSGVVQEAYMNCIQHMKEQLGLDTRGCRNLAEVKRRIAQENFTHLFIGWEEYMEDKEYFDSIQEELSVVLVMDERPGAEVGAHIRQIYKPFYALSVAAVLNDESIGMTVDTTRLGQYQFIAPDASVLVVDDNLMNLRVMEGLLRPYKIKVFTATSGQEALIKLETKSYDFVFMDHMMPEMDGVECFHRIRMKNGRYFRELPVVILTANAIAGAREMFLGEGFKDFLAKPVELAALDRMLRKYIPEEKIQYLKHRKKAAVKAEKEMEAVKPEEDETETLAERKAERIDEIQEKEEIQVMEPEDGGEEKSPMEILEGIGIDVEEAISLYGGAEDFYMEMLGVYVENSREKMKEVEAAYAGADWKNYTILVHSVKSNAGSIGAGKLSALAKELEMAGKEDRITDIRNLHDTMMKEYKKTVETVERAVK